MVDGFDEEGNPVVVQASYDIAAGIARGRALIGVPFEHQGRCNTGAPSQCHGIDCAGLMATMLLATGWEPTDVDLFNIKNYALARSWHILEKFLDTEGHKIIDKPTMPFMYQVRPMDILLMKFSQQAPPQHVAIVTNNQQDGMKRPPYVIHTHIALDVVTEYRLGFEEVPQVVSVWRIKGF